MFYTSVKRTDNPARTARKLLALKEALAEQVPPSRLTRFFWPPGTSESLIPPPMAKGVSVSPRSGWIACSPRLSGRIFKAHKMATGSGSFWMSELAAKLVLDGNAFEIQNRIRIENRKRLDIARQVLPDEMLTSTGDCPYIWLKLPEPWLSGTFKNAAADHGISISSEDDYKVSRLDQTFHGVRIGLNSLVSLVDLKSALQTLRGILDSGIAGYDRNE